jgi:zinc protease
MIAAPSRHPPALPALAPLALAVLALLPRPAAGVERPEGRPVNHQGYFATYPTGLRLVVYELPGAPRASVGVSWLAGSMDDPPGKEGLAHLVEHLAFRCRVAGGTVWQRLQGDGVAFNAFTTHDATVFHETGKPDQLRSLLTLEIERMRDPLAGVTQADVDTEKAVVVSELRERNQASPEREGHEALDARLFGAGHPYARSVGGTEASVGSITLADVTGFATRLYRPDRAILAVISGRPAKEAAQLAFDRLGPLVAVPEGVLMTTVPPAVRTLPPAPPDPPPELLTIRGAVARPVLLVAFAVPGEAAEGRAMAGASASFLSNALRAALWGRGDYEKVASVNAWYGGHDGQGAIVARIELEHGLEPAKALGMLRDNLFSAGDRDSTQRLQVARQVRDSQLMSTYLALEHLSIGDVAGYTRATGKQDAVRGRQLQVLSLNQTIEDYWHQFMKRSRSAAVVVVPDPGNPELLRAGAGLADRMGDRHADRDLPFRPARPVEEVARPPGLDQVMRASLPNGLSVVMVRRPLLPFAEALLVIPTDLAGHDGTTTLLPRFAMSFAGTDADTRWMHSGRLGARGYSAPSFESVTFMRRGSADILPQLLEDLRRLTHSFEFSRSQATLSRDFFARELAAVRRTPSHLADQAFEAALYPDHPYGRQERPADLEPLRSGDAERWVDRELRPDLATLVVVGDIEPGGKLLEEIRSTFGGWSAGRDATPVRPLPPLPREARLILVDRPGARLAELKVGFRIPAEARGDQAAAEAVVRRLGQTLQETLRVDAGTTYGVHAALDDRPLAGALLVETAVDAGVAGEALVRLMAGVEGLAQVPLPDDAAARVRWLVARDFGMSFDTLSQVTSAMKQSALRGFPADHWEREAASIATLSPARIQALARVLLGREVVLVVGDARVVMPQLKDAGFEAELLKATP